MPSAFEPLIRRTPLPRGGEQDQRERGGGRKEEESDIQGRKNTGSRCVTRRDEEGVKVYGLSRDSGPSVTALVLGLGHVCECWCV